MHTTFALDLAALDAVFGGEEDGSYEDPNKNNGAFTSEAFDFGNTTAPPVPFESPPTTPTSPESPATTYSGARSDVAIERELGIGTRHMTPDQLADQVLQTRDFAGQHTLAKQLYDTARCGTLTDSEREAAYKLAQDPQFRAGAEASVYMKTNVGPGYTKESFGVALRTEGPNGAYHQSTVGIESPKIDMGIATMKLYGEHTDRSDRDSRDVLGVKLERELGPATVGVDLNSHGAKLYGKVESPSVRLPGGAETRFGAEVSVSAEGNSAARSRAENALAFDRDNRRAEASMGDLYRYRLPYECRNPNR